MSETVPEEIPDDDSPRPQDCPSQYPYDSTITCQLPYEHNPRMLHRRQTAGPDSPYYEWE
ncbi:hypothetical protein RM863_12765 [Streptomyces sp. DSM 41014]|uniref:Uncharacterized protein n=1 Tax=Streptomyces hintoniae TaxID=3075521 RepID=A0ABU2UJ38_9ACTN|nr:hypothetical protein [Streptomyces sp. DSM 41014]MDT0472996.1 hypothetical protein [Streptomyces sp. DSM 41014]